MQFDFDMFVDNQLTTFATQIVLWLHFASVTSFEMYSCILWDSSATWLRVGIMLVQFNMQQLDYLYICYVNRLCSRYWNRSVKRPSKLLIKLILRCGSEALLEALLLNHSVVLEG